MEEITPLVTGVKSYIYHRLGEITPLVTGLKSFLYIYISPTGRNCAVSYWRKILHIYIYIYIYHRLGEITPLVTGVKSYI